MFEIIFLKSRFHCNIQFFLHYRFLDRGHFVPDEKVIPFGIGKRYCLGQSLAEKEFFLFFVGLMQKFIFQTVPGTELPSYHIDKVNVKGILRTIPIYEVLLIERK